MLVRSSVTAGAKWNAMAYTLLKRYVRNKKKPFMCEDFREYCLNKLPVPPSNRAFGHLMTKARRDGLIISIGYQSTKNPFAHRTPATLWKAA